MTELATTTTELESFGARHKASCGITTLRSFFEGNHLDYVVWEFTCPVCKADIRCPVQTHDYQRVNEWIKEWLKRLNT